MSVHDNPTETLENSGDDNGKTPGRERVQRNTLPADLRAGRKLGPYTIIEEVGRGGMGVVFRAHDETLSRDVALKLIPPQFAKDEQKLGRFLREARSAAQLSHPGIVPIHFAGAEESIAFIAMGFVDGRPLGDLIEDGLIPPVHAVKIIRDVARALQHAHEKGIVHRDIKPDNIMLGHDGSVHITDFGLARSDSRPSRITDSGIYIGTPVYSSPEQVRAVDDVDGRADIYSLGVVFYEMVTGQTPFRAESPYKLFHAILHDNYEPAHEVNPLVPESVAGVIEKMMNRDRTDRYANAGQVADDCEKVLRVLNGSARVEPLPDTVELPRASSTRANRRSSIMATITTRVSATRIATGIAALLLVAFGVIGGVWISNDPQRPVGDTHVAPDEDPGTPGQPHQVGTPESDPTPIAQPDPLQPVERPRRRVLVLPFRNVNGLDALEGYCLGIPEMMGTSLAMDDASGKSFLAVIERDFVRRTAAQLGLDDVQNDPLQFEQLVRELNIEIVIRGNVLVYEDTLGIQARVYDVTTGEAVTAVQVQGSENQLWALVDQLATQLRRSLAERYAPELVPLRGIEPGAESPQQRRPWERALATDADPEKLADEVRATCDKLNEELEGFSDSDGQTANGGAVPGEAVEGDCDDVLRQTMEALESANRQLGAESKADEMARGARHLQQMMQDYNRSVLRQEQKDLIETLRKLAGPTARYLNLPKGPWTGEVEIIPGPDDSVERQQSQQSARNESGAHSNSEAHANGSASNYSGDHRDGRRFHGDGGARDRIEQLRGTRDQLRGERIDEEGGWEELDRDTRERLAQATRMHMIARLHLERAREARDAGDARHMQVELQQATIMLIRTLMIEPRFVPAREDLDAIRAERWSVTDRGTTDQSPERPDRSDRRNRRGHHHNND